MTLRELLEQITQQASLQGLMDKPVYVPEDDDVGTPQPAVKALLRAYTDTAEDQLDRMTLREQRQHHDLRPIDGVVLKVVDY